MLYNCTEGFILHDLTLSQEDKTVIEKVQR